MPSKAQQHTRHRMASGFLMAVAKIVAVVRIAPRDTMASMRRIAGAALEASANTFVFKALAAIIQPKCREKGARKSQNSLAVKLSPTSAIQFNPNRLPRMPSMHNNASTMASCAKTIDQRIWKAQAAHHHIVTRCTIALARNVGNI